MKTTPKILIVDDDTRNIRIIQEILEELYTLDAAHNGIEALEKIASFKPDLVLLDNMMPDINGIEVCRRVRVQLKNKHIIIIIVSGRASQSDQNESFMAGANLYLIKPFEDETLIATIAETLTSNNSLRKLSTF